MFPPILEDLYEFNMFKTKFKRKKTSRNSVRNRSNSQSSFSATTSESSSSTIKKSLSFGDKPRRTKSQMESSFEFRCVFCCFLHDNVFSCTENDEK